MLVVAQLAGIQAAKLTAQLIPLCHSLNLKCVRLPCMLAAVTRTHTSSSWVQVGLSLDHQREAVNIRAEAQTTGATGVEMEALTGAPAPHSVATPGPLVAALTPTGAHSGGGGRIDRVRHGQSRGQRGPPDGCAAGAQGRRQVGHVDTGVMTPLVASNETAARRLQAACPLVVGEQRRSPLLPRKRLPPLVPRRIQPPAVQVPWSHRPLISACAPQRPGPRQAAGAWAAALCPLPAQAPASTARRLPEPESGRQARLVRVRVWALAAQRSSQRQPGLAPCTRAPPAPHSRRLPLLSHADVCRPSSRHVLCGAT